MKNIIFSNDTGTFSHPQTIKDIHYARSLDVELVLLSESIDLARELSVRYIIMSNGTSIFDTNENKEIHSTENLVESIKWLANHLGVDLSKTMGITNSDLEISMFDIVNSSYVLDNSSDELKAKSQYYTSDVLQNGLGEAIIDYLHREKLDRK